MAEYLGVTAITSGVVAVFRILELTYELKAVGEQTTALLNLVQHVDRNIREARRLLAAREPLLSADEMAWMRSAIRDTEAAVRSVAQLIEPARVAMQATRALSFRTRGVWVFRDSKKAVEKMAALHTCHQTLTTVISSLYSKDVVVVRPMGDERPAAASAATAEEDAPPAYDGLGDFLNWRRRRRERAPAARMAAPRHLSEPDVSAAAPEMPPLRHTCTSPPRELAPSDSTDWDKIPLPMEKPPSTSMPELPTQTLTEVPIPTARLDSPYWDSMVPSPTSRESSLLPISPVSSGAASLFSAGPMSARFSPTTPQSDTLWIGADRTMDVSRDANPPVINTRRRASGRPSSEIGRLWLAYQAERTDLGHQEGNYP